MTAPQFKVTPQTHPHFFVEEIIGDQKFWVRKVISVKVQEYREDLFREGYELAHPEECKEGIDEVKYRAWLRSDEGSNATDRIDMDVLFLPQEQLPADYPIDELMSVTQLRMAQGFLQRPSTLNTNVPDVSSDSTSIAPDSEQPSDQPTT